MGEARAAPAPGNSSMLTPRDRTIELWHGDSFGHTCNGCGLTIATAHKMSLICADDWRVLRFHADCFQVWDAERQAPDDLD